MSLDIHPASNPTLLVDILNWDYLRLPPGFFDVIWASPPCVEYSLMTWCRKRTRHLRLADKLVAKVLEIIRYFGPQVVVYGKPGNGSSKVAACDHDDAAEDAIHGRHVLQVRSAIAQTHPHMDQ